MILFRKTEEKKHLRYKQNKTAPPLPPPPTTTTTVAKCLCENSQIQCFGLARKLYQMRSSLFVGPVKMEQTNEF